MLNKGIKFLIENKLTAVLLLDFFVGWGIVNAPFNYSISSFARLLHPMVFTGIAVALVEVF